MMTIDYNRLAPQNGPVLSYSVTNDRGWNDPPSFAFSPNSTGNRKRIDPRKRVAHNITSMSNGYASPLPNETFKPIHQISSQPVMNGHSSPYPNTTYAPPAMNGLSNGFHNMSITPAAGPIHHSSSNPDLNDINNQMQNSQMPMMHHSASVPAHMNQAGQNRIPGHALGTVTPPPSSCNTPPLIHQRCGSATPPISYIHDNTTNTRKMSAPGMTFTTPSIFSQHGTPTMLQSSHLKPNETGPFSTPVKFAPPATQPTSLPPRISPMPPTVPEHMNNAVYNRSYSNPEVYRKQPSPTVVPPPTAGYYAQRIPSGTNSPKSISPITSGKSSPVPPLDPSLLDNDNEALTNTLNFLNDTRNKCSCNLTNKMSEDIGKKLQVFEASWRSGKLSKNTKLKMLQLAQAFNGNDLQLADKLHKSLIHEHSNEVSSWIIAIKKLITTYQTVAVAQ